MAGVTLSSFPWKIRPLRCGISIKILWPLATLWCRSKWWKDQAHHVRKEIRAEINRVPRMKQIRYPKASAYRLGNSSGRYSCYESIIRRIGRIVRWNQIRKLRVDFSSQPVGRYHAFTLQYGLQKHFYRLLVNSINIGWSDVTVIYGHDTISML